MVDQGVATKLALQAHAAAALEARRRGDEPQRVPVRAQMRHEVLEFFQRECPGPPPVADRHDERMLAAKTRHTALWGLGGEVHCGAGFAEGGRLQGAFTDAARKATLRRSCDGS